MQIQVNQIAKQYLDAIDYVVKIGKCLAEGVHCVILGESQYLTRFANNQVIQNVRKRETQIVVQIQRNGQTGIVSGNQLDQNSLEELVQKAVQLAKYSPVESELAPFPHPEIVSQVFGFDENSEFVSPEQMTQAVQVVIDEAISHSLQAAGACQLYLRDQVVANSQGVRLFGRQSCAKLHAVVMGEKGSGYAEQTDKSFEAIDPQKIARIAVAKCLDSQNPISLEPGKYPVLLEPKAVGELILTIGDSFNPIHFHEGRSFLSGKMGYRVWDEKLSLTEDPLSKDGIAEAFDWDGQARKKVPLIQEGVANGLVYDAETARCFQQKSTGNGRFPIAKLQGMSGPTPTHLHLESGKSSIEEMMKGIDRGILITRFHYLGMQHSKDLLLTGTTRDGTFLVENGQIKAPIYNLRFTQKLTEAFQRVIAVGSQTQLISSWFGSTCRVPALSLEEFTFTEQLQH